MKKNLSIIVLLAAFAGCVTQKKVNTWLNDHPTAAAGYCADNFPPDTVTKTVFQTVDSSGYLDAYLNMSYLADSLFYKLDSLQHLPGVASYKLNIDSLRKAVDKEIRRRLKPCVDSVVHITNTVVDRAREKQLQGKLDEKDAVVSAKDNRITELESQVKGLKKWPWLFWLLVALVAAGLYLNQKFKLLNKIKSYVK
jgi:hypothetical protein